LEGYGLGACLHSIKPFRVSVCGSLLEIEAFWHQIVNKKYGSLARDSVPRGVTGSYGVSLWKSIRRGWDIFYNFTSVEVGDGSYNKFWHDICCGDHPLTDSFQELFCLAGNRNATVADLGNISNGTAHWDINFTRLVHDWEVDSVSFFFNVLYYARVS
jgi:hypothetical protein